MAQYDVTYSCGHSATVQLYGPGKDRQRKIKYFSEQGLCKACWVAEQKAKDAAAPCIVNVTAYGIGAHPMIACVATGGIEANKAALAAIGFKWTDEAIGFSDFFSARNDLHFALTREVNDVGSTQAWLDDMRQRIEAIGYAYKPEASILDGAMFREAVKLQNQAKAEKDAAVEAQRIATEQAAKVRAKKLAANPRPARPSWYQTLMEGGKTCNCKVYGAPGRWSIYVSDVKYILSNEQKQEFDNYLKALEVWKAAIA